MTETVCLAEIRTDGGTQSRAAINDDVVADYAEAIEGGATLPPVVVYHDGEAYWLADGFHRYAAHVRAGRRDIAADVRQGTRRDAILHSVGANAAHGLRRTNEDKRRAVAVLLGDAEWSTWSDREIARRAAVHHMTVAKLRTELNGEIAIEAPRKFTTKHGTTAERRVAPRASEPAPEAAPASAEAEPQPQPAPAPEPAPAAPAPEPADNAQAAERRKLAKLTREALEDDFLGLRVELAKVKAERDELKARLAEVTQGDMGRALGQMMRQRDTIKGRLNELMAKNVRQARRIQHLEKERDAARREIETQEIPLN